MNLFKMAWRNVWRSRRRSLVTIAAMAFALWVELLYSGLVVGYMSGMERDVVDVEVGDLQIHAAGYRDKPSLYSAIDHPQELLARLDDAGFAASARLLGGGLAAAGELSAGVALRGVEVERDAGASLIHQKIDRGAWLDPADPDGVVVGRRLARTLDVKPGDELVVLSQAADGSLANELYRVRGVLLGVAEGTDRAAVFMTAAAFRELMVFPTGAHQVIVRRPPGLELEAAAARVRELAPGLDVATWRQLMPVIATMLDSVSGLILVIFAIVYVAVGILILNAMLMAVFERIREFGVLKALGAGPRLVLKLILIESAIQTALAIAVGVALALPAMGYLSRVGIDAGSLGGVDMMGVAAPPVWRGVYDAGTLAGPLAMLLVIVALAVLYPALKAAWIRPVEAMRHQ
jgi:ABC-type lipoprotein release transport system permease subunit